MKRCTRGLWDESIPDIYFNDKGQSNYSILQQHLMDKYPRGDKGKRDWNEIVNSVKAQGKRRKYDCVVGVSGGVDSSYLLYLLKEVYGLRPLAVTLDNGWSSDIAVKNIKLMTDALGIELETYVIDYEEIKDLIRSFMFAGLPWIDAPTDIAIKAVMYKIALENDIKFIFRGNDFRTEGKQPLEWTYCDDKQVKFVHKHFGKLKALTTYPYLPYWKIIYSGFFRRIKDIRPFYYLDYSKIEARKFLEKTYGWKYYGGHHHENIFTKFVMSYWLPEKFKIDKRIINLSAQVMSGYITREEAISELETPALSEQGREEIIKYVLKKLDLTENDFSLIMTSPNKTYRDYPNQEKSLHLIMKFFRPLIGLVYPQKPMTFVAMEVSNGYKKPGVIVIEGHVQGLSNTRALGENGIPVVVVDKNNCISRYSRYCKSFLRCPDYKTKEFKDFLINIAEKNNLKGYLLLPSNDHAVKTIIEHRAELENYYRIFAPGYEAFIKIYDKLELAFLCKRLNVPIPETFSFNNVTEALDSQVNYPLLIKGKYGLNFYKKTGKKVIQCNDQLTFKKQIEEIDNNLGIDQVIIQGLIDKENTQKTVSFTAFVVDGVIKTYWIGEKIREHPLRFGTATCARSIGKNECFDLSKKILESIGYSGVCEIEYLYDSNSKSYKLIEINARTWLWVGLARHCGIDYANLVYNYVNKLPLRYPEEYKENVKWINYLTDTLYSLKALAGSDLTIKEYLRSLKGKKINAVFSWKDLLPGLVFIFLIGNIYKHRIKPLKTN